MTPASRWARPVLVLLALQLLFYLTYRGVQHVRGARGAQAHVVESRPAPELAYRDASGVERRLSDLRGRPVLVHFWATWCPPCRDEMPLLLEHAATSSQVVLAVSTGETPEVVRGYFDGSWPAAVVVADGPSVHGIGVNALPETWLVDPTGRLRLRFVGARDWTSPSLRSLLDQHSR